MCPCFDRFATPACCPCSVEYRLPFQSLIDANVRSTFVVVSRLLAWPLRGRCRELVAQRDGSRQCWAQAAFEKSQLEGPETAKPAPDRQHRCPHQICSPRVRRTPSLERPFRSEFAIDRRPALQPATTRRLLSMGSPRAKSATSKRRQMST